MSGLFGEIPTNTSIAGGQFIKRKDDNSGWEGGLPSSPSGPQFSILDVYPIGAIYLSVAGTSPAILFGGTWAAIGEGRVLVGIKSADPDFNEAEETGGTKTVASVGTNTAPAFTGTPSTAIVNHTHGFTNLRGLATGSATTNFGGIAAGADTSSTATPVVTGNPQTGGVSSYTPAGNVAAPTFTGAPTSIVQPYLVVYMWKRVA